MKIIYSAIIFITVIASAGSLSAQTGDDLGVHEMSASQGGNISSPEGGGCRFCHAPHGALSQPGLWNQTLSSATYTGLYSSSYNQTTQPKIGSDSSLCLSCHDGTVAIGLSVANGQIPTSGAMDPAFVQTTDLSSSHPFSFNLPIKNTPFTTPLLSQGRTNDPEVPLPGGNVECTSCHNPHKQYTDPNGYYMIVNNSDVTPDRLCNACHGDMSAIPTATTTPTPTPTDPTATPTAPAAPAPTAPTTTASAPDPSATTTAALTRSMTMSVANAPGPQSTVSSHSSAAFRALGAPVLANGSQQRRNMRAGSACQTCHTDHTGMGGKALLRSQQQELCTSCHSPGGKGAPLARDITSEIAKGGHNDLDNQHRVSPVDGKPVEDSRHASCADCHNPHAAKQVSSFSPPPAIRASQSNVPGVSALDGTTPVKSATTQYETCFRCHNTQQNTGVLTVYGYNPLRASSVSNPKNFVLEFGASAASSHPVTHNRSSSLPQPSLRPAMTLLDGRPQGRAMGSQIFCSDCHNSDDNREFGGTGANGPHGSKFSHILERRYEFSQAAAPGQTISNLNQNPDLSTAGPYALCAKCHDLTQVVRDTSFQQHSRHINAGFSCSVCHAPHGVSRGATAGSGERLVNFDTGVVARVGTTPISYNRQTQSCSLTCHGHAHNLQH